MLRLPKISGPCILGDVDIKNKVFNSKRAKYKTMVIAVLYKHYFQAVNSIAKNLQYHPVGVSF